MRALLERILDDKKQTLGKLYLLNDRNKVLFQCYTMELPWKHNQKRISCIPLGNYEVIKHRSRKFGNCLWLLRVPHRSEILIHAGNYYKDTLGCILPGEDLKDLNRDKLMDVTNSGNTMEKILELLPKKFQIEIIESQNFQSL